MSPTNVTMRSPTRVAIQPPSTAPIGSAIRNRSSKTAASVWLLASTPWPNSSTLTSVTISAAPAHSDAPSAARNGRKCTPAGSISRVRANRSQMKNATAATARREEHRQSVARQHLLAVGRGVVQPDHRQAQRDASSTPPTTSTVSGFSGLTRGGQAEMDHHHRDRRPAGTLIQNTSRQVFRTATTAMPYSGPSTLPSSCAAPIPPSTGGAVAGGPEVGGQRQCDRQQCAAGRRPGSSGRSPWEARSFDSAVTTEPTAKPARLT